MVEESIKEEKYKLLFKQITQLINDSDPVITNLANVTAAIKQTFNKVSWVGFYLAIKDKLFLGPFQGKVACTKIEIGKGVCGTAAKTLETQVVPNVHEFPGHIACDVESNSEIVVPLVKNGKVYGVLDLDSTEFSTFTSVDKIWLEKIVKVISDRINFEKINF